MDNKSPDELASWITEKVSVWESWRNQNYDERWSEYYRLWRGVWTEADANRQAERSRIICPELSQAIETSVAELEDATFIRERWVDVQDDLTDQDKQDVANAVNLMLEDFNEYGVPDQISEAYLNGAIYGTGIAKVVVEKKSFKTPDATGPVPAVTEQHKICVKLVPISPRNFVIDPIAKSVDEALGCAHVFTLPLSEVQRRINNGMYKRIELSASSDTAEDSSALGELGNIDATQLSCKVVEWHGLVPKRMIDKKEKLLDNLEQAVADMETLDTTIKPSGGETEELVEAIVVIINDDQVARAVMNPFLFGDRSIIAFQYDTVPNRFWGRGVGEKGYNPQKALDAEIRARIDALALSTHPMMGIDSTRIPRGETFQVRPGRSILTTGNPAEILMPVKFPAPDPHTFQQTQELREMIQRGTGSYELPANAESSRMAATSMSMVVGSMIKRSRRTLSNIERQFLKPMVQKVLYRYMQFDPERFPLKDYKFNIRASMGIMAREFEQGQLVSLLSTVPAESPAFWMLIKGIYTNSNIEDREQMIAFADQMLQNAMNPQPPPPDPKVLVEQAKLQFEAQKHKDTMDLEAVKAMQVDRAYQAEAKRDEGEGKMQTATAVLQLVKSEVEQLRASSEAALNLAKAESERTKVQLEAYKIQLEAMRGAVETATQVRKDEEERQAKAAVAASKQEVEAPEVEIEDKPNPAIEKLIALVQEQSERLSKLDVQNAAQSKMVTQPDDSKYLETQNMLRSIMERLNGIGQPQEEGPAPKIERGPDGRVISVNGTPVTRDDKGLISGLEE